MENRPEFVWTWLGLAKIGVATALINTSLRDEKMLHCINEAHSRWRSASAHARMVIADDTMAPHVLQALHASPGFRVWQYGRAPLVASFDAVVPISNLDDTLAAIATPLSRAQLRVLRRGACPVHVMAWIIASSMRNVVDCACVVSHGCA